MNREREIRNLIWNLIGTTVNAFMSLVYQVVVTRVNGLEATGVFSVCFSFSLVFQTIVNLGGRIFEVADRDGNDDTYYTLKWGSATIALFFSLLYALLSEYAIDKCLLVLLFMLIRIIESFSDTMYAILQKNERLDLVGISYTLKNTTAFLGFVIIDYLTRNLIFAVFAMLGATIAVYLTFDRMVSARFHVVRINPSFKDSAQLFKRVLGFLGYNLLIMVIANMPKLVADLKYSESQMGYFGILMMIPTVMLLLGQVIIQQYLTRITHDYRSGRLRNILKTVLVVFSSIVGLSILCCVFAYFLGVPVLNMVYGLRFERYQTAMFVLVMSGMFNVFVTLLSAVLTVMEHSQQQMYLYLIVSIIEITALYYGLSGDSIERVFVMYLLIMIIQFVVFLLYFCVVLGRMSWKTR